MKLTVLNSLKHKDLRIKRGGDFSFASKLHTCPLLYTEIAEASRSYPIVFPPLDSKVMRPQALLSAIPNQNNLVQEDGKWSKRYLPIHLRRHPFYLGREEGSDQVNLMFDEECAAINTEEGEPLFIEDEGRWIPGPVLEQIKMSLTSFDNDYQVTTIFCGRLQEAGVLVPGQLTVNREGVESSIGGFSAVDWKKVTELSDETLADWTRSGLVQLIHNHRYSLNLFGLQSGANVPGAEAAPTETED